MLLYLLHHTMSTFSYSRNLDGRTVTCSQEVHRYVMKVRLRTVGVQRCGISGCFLIFLRFIFVIRDILCTFAPKLKK